MSESQDLDTELHMIFSALKRSVVSVPRDFVERVSGRIDEHLLTKRRQPGLMGLLWETALAITNAVQIASRSTDDDLDRDDETDDKS